MNNVRRPLYAMFAELLVAYTQDFDEALECGVGLNGNGERPPSLAMWANVLRFVGDDGVALRELPSLSGISKSTIKSMVNCLQRHGWIAIDSSDVVRLTERGMTARRAWPAALDAVERAWEAKLGPPTLEALRTALESATSSFDRSLPHYPMPAAHRGALPTGE